MLRQPEFEVELRERDLLAIDDGDGLAFGLVVAGGERRSVLAAMHDNAIIQWTHSHLLDILAMTMPYSIAGASLTGGD